MYDLGIMSSLSSCSSSEEPILAVLVFIAWVLMITLGHKGMNVIYHAGSAYVGLIMHNL